MYEHSQSRSKQKPMKNVGNSSRGRSQGVPKIFRAPVYRAHCAVIFAIAQLSCFCIGTDGNGVTAFPISQSYIVCGRNAVPKLLSSSTVVFFCFIHNFISCIVTSLASSQWRRDGGEVRGGRIRPRRHFPGGGILMDENMKF